MNAKGIPSYVESRSWRNSFIGVTCIWTRFVLSTHTFGHLRHDFRLSPDQWDAELVQETQHVIFEICQSVSPGITTKWRAFYLAL